MHWAVQTLVCQLSVESLALYSLPDWLVPRPTNWLRHVSNDYTVGWEVKWVPANWKSPCNFWLMFYLVASVNLNINTILHFVFIHSVLSGKSRFSRKLWINSLFLMMFMSRKLMMFHWMKGSQKLIKNTTKQKESFFPHLFCVQKGTSSKVVKKIIDLSCNFRGCYATGITELIEEYKQEVRFVQTWTYIHSLQEKVRFQVPSSLRV